MSWAANNPEAYDTIEIEGVTDRLMAALSDYGYDSLNRDDVRAVVETISNEVNELPANGRPRSAWEPLVEWASKEVAEQESSYHTRGI